MSWSAGTRLQPERIAQGLGVSRMPVRDAISQLDGEGLVAARPLQGDDPPAAGDLELYEISAALEALAARTRPPSASPIEISRNCACSASAWSEASSRLGAGQQHLLQEIRRVRRAVQPYLLMFFNEYRQKEMTGDEHRFLIDALASRNGVLAERTFSQHIVAAGEGAMAFMARAKPRRPAQALPNPPKRDEPK